MEVSTQPLLSRQESRPSSKDDANKENICPLHGLDMASLYAALGWIRSPLPQGSPRSPLQDISHILCPHNIRPEDEDPLTRQAHKKLKNGGSAEVCSVDDAKRGSSWQDSNSCLQLKLTKREVLIEQTVKPWEDSELKLETEEDEHGENAGFSEKLGDVQATTDLYLGRVSEQVHKASGTLDCVSICIHSCMGEKWSMKGGAGDVEDFLCKVEMKEEDIGAGQGDPKQNLRTAKLTHVPLPKEVKGKRPQKPRKSTFRSTSNILKFR